LFQEVVAEKGTKEELFNRCIYWLNNYYRNSTRVTTIRDVQTGRIEGRHNIRLYYFKDSVKTQAGTVDYVFKIDLKQDKFRYTISDLKLRSKTRVPIEKWLDKDDPEYNPHWDEYLQQIADFTATAESAADSMISGSLERGWSSYLTLYSQENNLNINGEPRINFNDEDLTKLHQDLSAVFSVDVANFVILYRQGLPAAGSSDGIPIPAAAYQVDLTVAAEQEITQILQLIGISLEGPPAEAGEDHQD